jgi:transcriptional regulator with XRE-family HTH domain
MKANEDRSMAKKTLRLFRALVDDGSLSFPELGPSSSSTETLSARMREALSGNIENDDANAADLLKARRKVLKLEVTALARKAELSLTTLRALESGRLAPTDIQPEVFGRVLLALGVGFEAYLDVHGRSVRPRKGRSNRSAALKRRHERRPEPRAAAPGSDWLTRLAEALKRPTTT